MKAKGINARAWFYSQHTFQPQEKTMKRYSVHRVADEHCDKLGRFLSDHDLLDDAREAADDDVSPFGTAIHDHATDEIDFGQGFGVAIEVPQDAE